MPACPRLLGLTVSSPARSYPGVAPNPSWASAAPRGRLWSQGVEKVERGRGVAPAAVWVPPAPQGAPRGTSVCLEARDIRDTAAVGQEGWTHCQGAPGSFPEHGCGAGAHPGLQGQQRGAGAVLGLRLRLCLLPATPVCPAVGCGAGSWLWAQSCPMAPLHPAPFPLQQQREGGGSFSLGNAPGLGGGVSIGPFSLP